MEGWSEAVRIGARTAELVRGCLAGEQGAWEALVREHYGSIYNFAYRYAGRFEEAEDLAQEIFVKFYRGLRAYRVESGSLVGWLLRVGRNHIIDRSRCVATVALPQQEQERSEENATRTRGPVMLGALLLITLGILFLLNNLYPADFAFSRPWPVVLIVIGLKIVEHFQHHRLFESSPDEDLSGTRSGAPGGREERS